MRRQILGDQVEQQLELRFAGLGDDGCANGRAGDDQVAHGCLVLAPFP